MKIILNSNEIYEIKLPEQIELQELAMITARFNSLLKNFSKFNLIGEETERGEIILGEQIEKKISNFNKEQWIMLKNDREVFKELLSVYYNKTPEELEEYKNKHNITITRQNMASAKLLQLREFHRLKPVEVGLIRFPTRKDKGVDLKIK